MFQCTLKMFRSVLSGLLSAAVFAVPLTGCVAGSSGALLPWRTAEEGGDTAAAQGYDLIICTAQDEVFYGPVVKEFEERTNLRVMVQVLAPEQLLAGADKGEKKETADWDVVFGVGVDTLELLKENLLPYESPEEASVMPAFRCPEHTWTGFSSQPLVIMYNTNVVTYRELPVGWKSLLEPRWKGRVAFVDPNQSDVYASALAVAAYACSEKEDYLSRLAENLNYNIQTDSARVNTGIAAGRYSVGVTVEESAQALRLEGADIDYIYPEEGTIALLDGTAIRKDCAHLKAAREFVDFTVSKDVQRILVSNLKRRSVRRDVAPCVGLDPIERLPVIEMDTEALSEKKSDVLKQWNQIMEEAGV